jgi:hypothetical protein
MHQGSRTVSYRASTVLRVRPSGAARRRTNPDIEATCIPGALSAQTQLITDGTLKMKVWSDFSVIVKLSLICVCVGFIVGLCSSGAILHPMEEPSPSPSMEATGSMTDLVQPVHRG